MKKTNNIIKINGKHYDANTGAPLQMSQGVKISDIKRVSAHHSAASRKAASPLKSHAPQPSKTLMRGPLKKPTVIPKHSNTVTTQSKPQALPKLSINGIDSRRLNHAKAVHKSKLISHFSDSYLATVEPVIINPNVPSISDIAEARLNPEYKPDFLQVAIDKATSHQEPPYNPKKGKKLKVIKATGVILGALVLVGIVGYQNIANLQLKAASSRAGFAASLPAYRATDFKLDNIISAPGEVAVNFNSARDSGKNYTIKEKPSTWDSNTLLETFVVNVDKNYRAIETTGQTVYLYGNNNATWVNGRIWYTITGNGSLSDSQIANIVASL